MILAALLLLQVAPPRQSAQFASRRLRESSGVAVSRAHPGLLWTHNDSGDGPYLYATDLEGRDLGWLLVPGARAVDWEDMALGPCPVPSLLRPVSTNEQGGGRASTCVYIADTGDNIEGRPWVTIYAILEPRPPQSPGDTLRVTSAPAVLRLRYPDGAHDVEAIYVSPRDTALYLVSKGSKRGSAIRLYRVDRSYWSRPGTAATDEVAVASRVQTLDIRPNPEAGRVVTGAAIRPDGRVVALRTYNEIFFFHPGVGGRLGPARAGPCDIAGLESGGEAIAFLGDSTFVLTSEAAGRHPGTIHTVTCPL